MSPRISLFAVLVILCFCFRQSANACSMYKITAEGKTMVGCNEDAWRTTSRIWFETKAESKGYGAAFTGSREVGKNKFAPQSGMNEVGLVFSRLTSYHPKKDIRQEEKKKISNEVVYLSEILHNCKDVKEVKKFISTYDHSFFMEDVFIYIDASGDYLIVEPYDLIEGNDPTYVLSNFCPSITSKASARKIERYKSGDDYLKIHPAENSLNFCTAMSDTMHVCRSRNGDGTLLTSIWDTQNGLVNLYFYHSYDSTIQFNLAAELAKGDHMLDLASLFPINAEFSQLSEYKTPFNVPTLRIFMVLLGGLLFLLSLLYSFTIYKENDQAKLKSILLFFGGLNLLLMLYLIVLVTNKNIYYFDAPYQHYSSILISLSSYIPLILLLLIVPLSFRNLRFYQFNKEQLVLRRTLLLNNFIYLTLIIAFGYWGLFNVL